MNVILTFQISGELASSLICKIYSSAMQRLKFLDFVFLEKKAIMLNLGASLFFEIGSLSNSGCPGICCLDQTVLELREPLAPAS